jgi:serine/threonine protein kinase
MTTESGIVLAGRYRLLDQLGRGGMGTVWRARDEVLGREVAIKEVILPPAVDAAARDGLIERTRREARLAARLNHRNVVTVFDVVDEDGRPWLVMELVPSRSLTEVVEAEGPLPPARAAELGLQLLGALEAAHGAGVLHRDVKPGNVLITAEGRVVLGDFGIARLEGDPSLTGTGLVMGSPAYMAPERARGHQVGPASDLWSLGATLYTAVEGRAPFSRDGAVPTLTAVVTDEPDPFRLAGPLAPLLTGLLGREPGRRPSVAEARAELQRVIAAARRMPETPAAPAVATPPLREAQRTRALPPSVPDTADPEAGAEPPEDAEPLEDTQTSAAAGTGPPPALSPIPTAPARASRPAASRAAQSRAAHPVGVPPVGAPPAAVPPAAVPPAGTRPVDAPPVDAPPADAPPADAPPADAARRRRYALAAGAVVLVFAASLGGWLLLRPDDKPTGQPGARSSQRASATPTRTAGSPSAKSSSAAPSPSQTPSGGDTGGAAVPAGYTRRTDPTGFSLAIPAGWTVRRSGEGNRFVYFEDPQSARYLLVDQTDNPQDDPAADWRAQAANRGPQLADYREIGIRSVDYFLRAADWEFTYTMDGTGPVHVRNRGFVTSEDQGYALYLLTPEDEWESSQDEWRAFTETFRPAG